MNHKPMLTVTAFVLLVLLCVLLAACRPPSDVATPTVTPTPSLLANVTGPLTATLTLLPKTAQPCLAPLGWAIHTIAADDTLFALAAATGSTVEAIMVANCLESDVIVIGFSLVLPILPPPTLTPAPSATPCGPPGDWVIYLVQPGDTLYELAQQTGVTTAAVQNANCFASLEIFAGRGLYLPFQPGRLARVDPGIGVEPGNGGGNPVVTPLPDCPTAFVCIQARDVDPPRPLSSGDPNEPNGLCYDDMGNPLTPGQSTIQIGARTRRLIREGDQLSGPLPRGEWVFFAACGFSAPTTTMQLTHNAQSIPLSTQTIISGTQQFVLAAWPILCDRALEGDYELIVEDGAGHRDQFTFQLAAWSTQILAVPYRSGPGAFDIYFCNYDSNAGALIDIALFSHPTQNAVGQRVYTKWRTDKVLISDAGWGKLRLMLPIGDETSARYLIVSQIGPDDEEEVEIR